MKEKVLIIGAGPAGLTAAYELSLDDKYDITILEASNEIGGISRTILLPSCWALEHVASWPLAPQRTT